MHYRRPTLAKALANELTGANPLSDAPNGLFLAAARRTGKTEFLKQDLLPALRESGLLVAYVDLWSDKTQSPMVLIANALRALIEETLGVVAKTAKGAGLNEINIRGFKIDLSKIGKTDGMTLYEVLALLRKQSGKRIALIIDEAQHALTSSEGDATMSALKSARDQLRDENGAGLLLIMSGSHRDKLMRLLSTSAAPFWGSQVRALPTLGRPFVNEIADLLRQQTGAPLNPEGLMQAFALCGERPQFFLDAIREATETESTTEENKPIEERVLAVATQRRQRDRDGLTSLYRALPKLEQAIFWRLLDRGAAFKPFDAESLKFYSAVSGKKISATQAQKALEKLRAHDPPLIWKSLRGEYSLYETEMGDWYAYLVGEHAWPPG